MSARKARVAALVALCALLAGCMGLIGSKELWDRRGSLSVYNGLGFPVRVSVGEQVVGHALSGPNCFRLPALSPGLHSVRFIGAERAGEVWTTPAEPLAGKHWSIRLGRNAKTMLDMLGLMGEFERCER